MTAGISGWPRGARLWGASCTHHTRPLPDSTDPSYIKQLTFYFLTKNRIFLIEAPKETLSCLLMEKILRAPEECSPNFPVAPGSPPLLLTSRHPDPHTKSQCNWRWRKRISHEQLRRVGAASQAELTCLQRASNRSFPPFTVILNCTNYRLNWITSVKNVNACLVSFWQCPHIIPDR